MTDSRPTRNPSPPLLNRSVLVSSATVIIIMLLRRASDLRKALGVRRTQNLARGEQSQSRSFASSDGRDRPSHGHVCVDSVAIGSIWDRGASYRQTLHEFPAIVVSRSRTHSHSFSLSYVTGDSPPLRGDGLDVQHCWLGEGAWLPSTLGIFTLVHFTSTHSVSYPTTYDVRRAGPAQSCRAGSDCERSLQGHRGQVCLELELLDPARTLPRHRLTLSSLSLSPQAVHRQEAAEPSVDLQREGRVRPPR